MGGIRLRMEDGADLEAKDIVKMVDCLYDVHQFPMNLLTQNPSSQSCANVVAVIVTYNPNKVQLRNLLEVTLPQVEGILVVDNGSRSDSINWLEEFAHGLSIELHLLHENRGVATAQNVGITLAKARGANFILLFDHDSLPSSSMVSELLKAFFVKEKAGELVGVVGPWYDDPRRPGESVPFVEMKGFRLLRKDRNDPEKIIQVSHVISSGSLFSVKALDAVGLMRDNLFIDCIDTEWCERARYKGFKSFGVCDALMHHSLGDDPQTIFGDKSYCFHSPLRLYYQFRNAIWLYRQPYPELPIKIGNLARLGHRFLFYALLARPRWKYMKMMMAGTFDGIVGRLGNKGD